jgi:hypothetical protein
MKQSMREPRTLGYHRRQHRALGQSVLELITLDVEGTKALSRRARHPSVARLEWWARFALLGGRRDRYT